MQGSPNTEARESCGDLAFPTLFEDSPIKSISYLTLISPLLLQEEAMRANIGVRLNLIDNEAVATLVEATRYLEQMSIRLVKFIIKQEFGA